MVSTDAKNIVAKLSKDRNNKPRLTTNQLRKFLAGVNGVYNRILAYQGAGKINGDQLPQEIVDEIEYIKVKLVYQSGRERNVKEFMQLADLEKRLDSIGNSKKKFIEFNRFIEGIVAYHKFEGGN